MTSITCHSLIFIFCHYPPFEEDVTLYFIQLDSHLPKDTLCQVWLKLAWWFLSRFLKVVNAFSLYGYYLPLEKIMAFKSNKFEFPLPKNTLCHVWSIWSSGSGGNFQKVSIFSMSWYYLPLEKRQCLSFERNLIPWTQGCSVLSLFDIGPVVLEKSSMYLHYVAIISEHTAWPFIWTNFNQLHLGMLYVNCK